MRCSQVLCPKTSPHRSSTTDAPTCRWSNLGGVVCRARTPWLTGKQLKSHPSLTNEAISFPERCQCTGSSNLTKGTSKCYLRQGFRSDLLLIPRQVLGRQGLSSCPIQQRTSTTKARKLQSWPNRLVSPMSEDVHRVHRLTSQSALTRNNGLNSQVACGQGRYHCCHSSDPQTGVVPGKPRYRNARSNSRCSIGLQFTLLHAAGCVLHRPTSQVIHRLELFGLRLRPPHEGPHRLTLQGCDCDGLWVYRPAEARYVSLNLIGKPQVWWRRYPGQNTVTRRTTSQVAPGLKQSQFAPSTPVAQPGNN